MLRGVHFEDVIKSVVGLAILAAAMVAFGPGLLEHYKAPVDLPPTSSSNLSNEHEIALKIEAELPKLDVLNIYTLDDRVVMTALDLAEGLWSEEDLIMLVDAIFYLVDLAQEEELPIVSQMLSKFEAITVEVEQVEVFVHQETIICTWPVIMNYDGTNATELMQYCTITTGNGVHVDVDEIAWIGRGE